MLATAFKGRAVNTESDWVRLLHSVLALVRVVIHLLFLLNQPWTGETNEMAALY